MEIKIIHSDSKIIELHETGMQINRKIYSSKEELVNYKRRDLSLFEDFLRSKHEIKEADKIKEYLGKTLKFKNIPQLIPTGNYKVNKPLDYLIKNLEEFKKEYNLNLDPEFQRAHVWTLEQRIAFVEFLLQGGKTNPIYFNYPNWMRNFNDCDEMVIIDGKQRLTSVIMFLNNEFPVFKNLDEDNVGYYYNELDGIKLGCDLEFVINDLNSREQEIEWYLQINKGNVAHTEEEIKKVEKMLMELKHKK